ncbi:uncharacterized protein LOC126635223 [Myiozetetes cayanensis]|uniref:uncharacterized protein LOC126635223 n=1 Tax=Myiozetetes cayanensis TaxID=478635 RepID=UPI002160EEA5|nr:uncharacterized protein LOC126635223 [Myiozetetes cayanensis]
MEHGPCWEPVTKQQLLCVPATVARCLKKMENVIAAKCVVRDSKQRPQTKSPRLATRTPRHGPWRRWDRENSEPKRLSGAGAISISANVDPAPAEGSKPSPSAAGSAAPGVMPGRVAGAPRGTEGGTAAEKGSMPLSAAVAAPLDETTSNGVYVPPAANGDVEPMVSTMSFVDFLMQLEDYTPTIPDAVTERLGAAWSRSRLRVENRATEQACAGGVTQVCKWDQGWQFRLAKSRLLAKFRAAVAALAQLADRNKQRGGARLSGHSAAAARQAGGGAARGSAGLLGAAPTPLGRGSAATATSSRGSGWCRPGCCGGSCANPDGSGGGTTGSSGPGAQREGGRAAGAVPPWGASAWRPQAGQGPVEAQTNGSRRPDWGGAGQRSGFGEHVSAVQSCEAFATRLHLERGQPVLAAGPYLELTVAFCYTSQPARATAPLKRTARPQQCGLGQPHMRHSVALPLSRHGGTAPG